MNKKGFVARDFVLGMILFSGIITLSLLAFNSLAEDYNNPDIIDDGFSENFNRFEEELNRSGEILSAAKSESGLSLVGTFDVLFSATFTVVSLVFGGLDAVGSQVSGFGSYFGVPSEVATVFFGILLAGLTVLIVFIIISSISQRDL